MKNYQHVILGGTFDHFHLGHKKLIGRAFELGEKVGIGIARENLFKDKFLAQTIEDFSIRKNSVGEFLQKKGWLSRAKLVTITDIFGSSITEKDIDAIVVSKMTYKNALKVNKVRLKRKLASLKIIVVSDILDTDRQLITSERIRAGEIDREGNLYINIFKKTLKLPDYLREELRRPLGTVLKGSENQLKETAEKLTRFINELKPIMVIAVGDIVSMALETVGFYPDVKIIDFRSRRKAIVWARRASQVVKNGYLRPIINNPGTISSEAVNVLQKGIKQILGHPTGVQPRQTIVVEGEEDLVTLPAILLAPLNSVVLYGQMNLGVVMIQITESMKKNVQKILKKFKAAP